MCISCYLNSTSSWPRTPIDVGAINLLKLDLDEAIAIF